MAGIYAPYKEDCLDSSAPDMTSVSVKWVAVDAADYTVDLTNHDFYSDIPAGAVIQKGAALSGKSITGGVFDASDQSPAFTAATGDPFEYLVLINDTPGTDATKNLICIADISTATPNGGDINVAHDNGASKIYKL